MKLLEKLKEGAVAATGHNADLLRRAAEYVERRGEDIDNSYVWTVPDHCDRIVWHGSYYHLPLLPQSEEIAELRAALADAERDAARLEWLRINMDSAITRENIDQAMRGES